VSLEGKAPCVKQGETVEEGQVIASLSPWDARVHAPMPGVVEKFVHCPLPDGTTGIAAQIRVRGSFSYLGQSKKVERISPLSTPASLCRTLAEKGVVNLYGRPVSLAAQIQGLRKKTDRVLVVRLYDNDESVPTDSFIAARFPRELAEGAVMLAAAAEAAGVAVLYRKGSAPPEEAAFTPAGKVFCALAVSPRRHLMPTAEEISGLLAVAAGGEGVFATVNHEDLFVNAASVLAAYRAVCAGIPVMESIIHVTGYPVRKPGMFVVRNGLLIADIIEECGGFTRPWAVMVINGVIRGTSITALDTPVTKNVQSIRFLHKSELPSERARECIRCGECRTVCPGGLEPVILMEYLAGLQSCDKAYVEQAVLCGGCALCSAVCPSRLPLAQYISRLKERILEGRAHD
jgi:electron transport complex protein RnfC